MGMLEAQGNAVDGPQLISWMDSATVWVDRPQMTAAGMGIGGPVTS
jgi:hypothetical protein